jgi:hypothetical protein
VACLGVIKEPHECGGQAWFEPHRHKRYIHVVYGVPFMVSLAVMSVICRRMKTFYAINLPCYIVR